MLTGQRWADMVDTLAKDMNNVNVIAAQTVSGELPETFILNANYSEYCIEEGFRTDYGFTLYDRDTVNRLVSENPDLLPAPKLNIPADLRWNKQKIASVITQAVLQGKPITDIAKSMETVVGMNKASAVRNVRTAVTAAQNAGRQQAYERAEAMGIKLQKEWIATLDGRTRHSHGMADGQKVDINGMFKVGGCKMRYPGDVANGTASEVYNCRCTMCTVEPPEIMQGEDERMTYSEWVQTKEGQEALEKARLDRNQKAQKRRNAQAKAAKQAQKTLDNGGGSDIINTEMFRKSEISRQNKKFISDREFSNITIEARKNGANILRGTPDIEKHLDDMNSAASTIGDTILFRKDVTKSEALEEVHHFMQNKKHLNDDKPEPLRTYLNEIEAKQFLIDNASKYHIPRSEVSETASQLNSYKELLDEYIKENGDYE